MARFPESATDIAKIARTSLMEAEAVGVLPTPIDDLIAAAKIENKSNEGSYLDEFQEGLSSSARRLFASALTKLRGLADLREAVIYVPPDKAPRQLFALTHEFGHQQIPWHKTQNAKNGFYHDDNYTLGPEAKEIFEQEANFFAAEVIFQGRDFINRALQYQPTFDTVFMLADQHGASRHATMRRYVESHDQEIAMISYYPDRRIIQNENDNPPLVVHRVIASKNFQNTFGDINIPNKVSNGHVWLEAKKTNEIQSGRSRLLCGTEFVEFSWEAWWNTYTLLILLKRETRIRKIKNSLRL